MTTAELNPSHDVINDLAGLRPESPVAELRTRRPDVLRHTQGSYDALLASEDESGLSQAERVLVALRVAILNHSEPLLAHYQQLLTQLGVAADQCAAVAQFPNSAALSPRLSAMLQHVERLTTAPRTATQAELVALQAHGLSARDLVTLAQLIAFLSFQVRVLAGVQSLAEEP
jgi:CMD domain protein